MFASFVAATACARVDEPTTPKIAESANTAVAFTPVFANFGGPSVPGAVPSPEGIVACFAAETNALDVVSNNVGALVGAVGYAGGRFGSAFDFTALGGGIDVATTPALNFAPAASGITMSAWIYGRGTMFQATGHIVGFGPIIEYDQGAHLWQHSQQGDANALFTNLAEGAASNQWHILQIPGVVGPNAWHHTAVTYSKSTGLITLYVDGVQVGQQNHGVFSANTATTLHIGRRALPVIGEPAFTFNGSIDEVQLYNRGLTAAEIGTLASANGTMCVPPPVSYQVSQLPSSSGESGVPFPTQPQVVILDANDNIVSNATTPVTATVVAGPGTLMGSTTVNAVNGVAQFTDLAIAGAGTTTVGFTTGSLPAEPNTATISIPMTTVQVPRQLVVVTQPTGAPTGTPLGSQPIVEIRDAASLRVPLSTNPVTASIGSGPGVLSGPVTVAAVDGVASFTGLVVTNHGTSTLSFASTGLTSATSNPFVVTGNPGTQLAMLTQPAGGESGMVFTTQPVVEVLDAGGARATTVTGSVTASIVSGTGSLLGTVTAPIVSGVATFTDLKINGFGTFGLRFSSGTMIAANSTLPVVQRVRQLAITGGPATVTTGVEMSPPWLVEIRDGAGLKMANATYLIRAGYGGTVGAVSALQGTLVKNAIAGVVTYDDLMAQGTGSFTLQFDVVEPGDLYASASVLSGNLSLLANNGGGGNNGGGNLLAALLRKGPKLNAGDVEGSLQILTASDVTLNGQAKITDKLYLPGMPNVNATGNAAAGTTTAGVGSATPTSHAVRLNGQATIGTLVRRTDAAVMPTVAAPATPTGTRNVTVNAPSDPIGSWSTVKNLTLNGLAGAIAVPAGTYGDITVHGSSAIVLGTVGATTPSVYNFQSLNGSANLVVVGPVVITTAGDVTLNSTAGSALNPQWLMLKIHNGGFTLNGGSTASAIVIAPSGKVTISGNSTLTGGIAADDLTLDGNNSKLKVTKAIPTP